MTCRGDHVPNMTRSGKGAVEQIFVLELLLLLLLEEEDKPEEAQKLFEAV